MKIFKADRASLTVNGKEVVASGDAEIRPGDSQDAREFARSFLENRERWIIRMRSFDSIDIIEKIFQVANNKRLVYQREQTK